MQSAIRNARKQAIETAKAAEVAPRLIRAKDAVVIMGSRQVVRDCEAAGWLSAKVRRHRLTLYAVADLNVCADRIDRGEYPKK